MKFLLAAGFAFIVLCSAFSCTKTNNGTTTIYDTTTKIIKDTTVIKDTVWEKSSKNPIVGLWIGKYLNNGDVDSFYYSYDIQPNGNMIATAIGNTNNSDATSGPWQLSGTNFTATLSLLTLGSPLVQSVTATYDSTAGTLTGQWMYTQGSGINGSFLLIRVP
ncbi:MAG TPA: hypothetical protein VFE32_11480 [Puia sp.]|jgi:hypothetical protein|nr:hypothetical protein [Puia sp.]